MILEEYNEDQHIKMRKRFCTNDRTFEKGDSAETILSDGMDSDKIKLAKKCL